MGSDLAGGLRVWQFQGGHLVLQSFVFLLEFGDLVVQGLVFGLLCLELLVDCFLCLFSLCQVLVDGVEGVSFDSDGLFFPIR